MATYQETRLNEYAKLYATNWFKVNEGGGTTLSDSKGASVGTITGATWISGGGLRFDGDDFVSLSQNIPLGNKSILIKFKITSLSRRSILWSNSTSTSSTTKNGYGISVNTNGAISVWYFKGSTSGATQSFGTVADVVKLNTTHTLLMTFSGTTVKIFLDDLKNPLNTTVLTQTEPTSFNPLFIGKENITDVAYQYPLLGELYDFTIYNQDIAQKFGTLNKSLILSNGEYKKWLSGWSTLSTTLPTSTQFLEQGMDVLTIFNRQVTDLDPVDMVDKTDILFTNGEVGKVYQTTVNLQKYIDLRNAKVEVK